MADYGDKMLTVGEKVTNITEKIDGKVANL